MLSITITNAAQHEQFEHTKGPVELGRGEAQGGVRRLLILDVYTSRNHLRLEEHGEGIVRVQNISESKPVLLENGSRLNPGERRDLVLPAGLRTGQSVVLVEGSSGLEEGSLHTIAAPLSKSSRAAPQVRLHALGESPPAEQVALWLEQLIALQRSADEGVEFSERAARALVELIGLEVGLVLFRKGEAWEVAAMHGRKTNAPPRFSRTLVNHVVAQRRTFFQDPDALPQHGASLDARGTAVVVSPVFGVEEEVCGVLYGTRPQDVRGTGRVTPLEAQVVQLLAGAVSVHLARSAALRTRVQFEQFFSRELVRELERDPNLLEARDQKVTVLVSDLYDFTPLGERLGAAVTCRLIRDVLEHLSRRITEQGGVIVDYAGDGILAMWNAPVPQEDHAARACRAGLAMLGEMPELNQRWRQTAGRDLELGIGINSGVAQVGNMGSSRKFKYGPHGHVVNLANRVQGATKQVPGGNLLMTEPTRALIGEGFSYTRCPPVSLKGVQGEVVLYALHGAHLGETTAP
jgi:adenylate cyclase